MKKIVSMFAAIVAAFSFNSCDNETLFEQPEQSSDITVNISVASLEPDTKAIKKNWANGDKINIWFGTATIQNLPQLVLTYDGTNWSASSMTETTISALKASGGVLYAVYEGTNSLFADAKSRVEDRKFISSTFGSETIYHAPMNCYSNKVSYTFSSNTLTANINSWEFGTNAQIVIAGLDPQEASNYALKVEHADDGLWMHAEGYYKNRQGNIEMMTGPQTYAGGTSNEDGVAFRYAFIGNGEGTPTGELHFTLIHKDASNNIDGTWTFTKNNTTLTEWPTTKCTGIKISKYKFMNTDANLLQGLFSVSATKTVQFTKGNLQATYNGTSYTWALAAHQYDFIGNAAGNTTIDAQTNGAVVDLFGLSTDAANNNWGIHTNLSFSNSYT